MFLEFHQAFYEIFFKKNTLLKPNLRLRGQEGNLKFM